MNDEGVKCNVTTYKCNVTTPWGILFDLSIINNRKFLHNCVKYIRNLRNVKKNVA